MTVLGGDDNDSVTRMNSYAGFLSEVFGCHDPSCKVSLLVSVISDDFDVGLRIAVLDTVGNKGNETTIRKLKHTAIEYWFLFLRSIPTLSGRI